MKEIGNGFKLFFTGLDGRCNGVGIIFQDDVKKGVLSVKRRSDRIMGMKVDLEGEIVNSKSIYAPQTGCGGLENAQFWEDLEDKLEEILESKLLVGGYFNGHCGTNNRGRENRIGRHEVGRSNEAGDNFAEFVVSNGLRVVNTFLKKVEEHTITYKSGAVKSYIDYVLCTVADKSNIRDCKVILGESVTSQHRPLVCTITWDK